MYKDIPRIWNLERIPEYRVIIKLLRDTFKKNRNLFYQNKIFPDTLEDKFLEMLKPELKNKMLWSQLTELCKNILTNFVLDLNK